MLCVVCHVRAAETVRVLDVSVGAPLDQLGIVYVNLATDYVFLFGDQLWVIYSYKGS